MNPDTATAFEFGTSDRTWRDRLLESLRDCGVQKAPRHPALRWILLIVFLIGLAIVTFVVRKLLEQNLRTEPNPVLRWLPYIVWYIVAVFLLARARNWFMRKAWQSTAATAEDELLKPNARRPILYLRSFQLDERMNRRTFSERFLGSYPSETAEQSLSKTLKSHGPTIAIGRPGEQLPSLGAARFYVTDDKWQQKVADVAKEAEYVVWTTGSTEGLRWEIEHLVHSVPPEKVILWAHPHLLKLSPPYRELEWARFRTALGGAFPKPLPETLGEARFIYFSQDWEPHSVAPQRKVVPWLDPVRSSLRGVMAVKTGQHDSRLQRWLARLGSLGIGILFAAIVALVIAVLLPDYVWTSRDGDQVRSRIPYQTSYTLVGFFANAALGLLLLSLAWGQSAWWKRTRLAFIGLLSALGVGMAIMAITEAQGKVFSNEVQVSAKSSKDDVVSVVSTNTYSQAVDFGVYVKLALALGIGIATVWFVKTRWRSNESATKSGPLTDADIAYPGPGNDTFAEIIGAAGPTFNWPRVGIFFAALLAMSVVPTLLVYQSASLQFALIRTAIECAVAVLAFRFLKAGIAPVIIAVIYGSAWTALLPMLNRSAENTAPFSFAEVARVGVPMLAFFAGLSWTCRRMGPRPFAFWFGAMAYPVALWIERYATENLRAVDNQSLLTWLLGPIVFAFVMELGLRILEPRAEPASI